jgi:hypothetical protein
MHAQYPRRPGLEAEMSLRPRFLAPDDAGSGRLARMIAQVPGGDSGIGRSGDAASRATCAIRLFAAKR